VPPHAEEGIGGVKRVLILGAAGRDFHNFNAAYRDDPDVRAVGFTAAQIPGMSRRRTTTRGRRVLHTGSMAPKVESAIQFVEATGRPAFITTLGAVAAALGGAAGTSVRV